MSTAPAMLTFRIGQPVAWPPSKHGLAQIDRLNPRRIRIVYETKTGRPRFATVTPLRLLAAQQQLLIPMHNPFNRGCLKRTRTYTCEIPTE